MTKFQISLTAIFIIFIIAGVTVFATYKSKDSSDTLPTINVWGTFPASVFNDFVQKLNLTRATTLNINYTEINPANFRKQFIDELARGKGPDAILVSQQDIIGYYDKIIQIPDKVFTKRDFQNSFTPQANLYLTADGSLAFPLIVDPLVMYWNRTMFTNAGIAKYPVYWDEFSTITQKLTLKDDNSNIRRSAIAMGEFNNINHAREIFGALLLQSGNPVTFYSDQGLQSGLGDSSYAGTQTSSPALNFFTQFSNPRDYRYSWNRSLPNSKSSFLSGTLGTYFGYTSEVADIKAKNPNLDFDVAPLPQARTGKLRVTYGNMYGLSMVRSTTNQNATFAVMQILTAPDAQALLSSITYLPSVRREAIATGSTDPYMAVFLDASLISKGWLDTSVERSNQIFTNLAESITSGKSDVFSALKQADDELNLSLKSQ